MRYILASQSPRRRELLKKIIDKNFEIIVSAVDENTISANTPVEFAMTAAEAKAVDIYTKLIITSDVIVIGADTVVALNNKIFGKPADKNAARKMISELMGKEHKVITGFCLYSKELKINICDFEASTVKIKKLNAAELDEYAAHSDCLDKAGAYAIQDMRSFNKKKQSAPIFDIVESYSGDYFNIVGLPIEKIKKHLDEINKMQLN